MLTPLPIEANGSLVKYKLGIGSNINSSLSSFILVTNDSEDTFNSPYLTPSIVFKINSLLSLYASKNSNKAF